MSKTLYLLEKVDFSYDKTKALAGVNLKLQRGKFYTILGPNGCGKTTLLDLLSGYRKPDSGTVFFNNKMLSSYSPKELAREVALVPQDFSLDLGFTLEEIVLMGRHPYMARFGSPVEEDWQLVNNSLENIGLNELRYKDASLLSGGQKQRAVVARALAQNTDTLLFDEATASLDIQYMLQIFNLAKQLVTEQGRTVIAVLHDINLASAYADEMIFMKDGQIHSLGAPKEIMTAKVIEEIFSVKAKVGDDLFQQPNQISLRYG